MKTNGLWPASAHAGRNEKTRPVHTGFGASAFALAALVGVAALPARAEDLRITPDAWGELGSASTNGFNAGATNSFFTPLGTNGRHCGTCHIQEDGWSFTPATARKVARANPADPLFAAVDGQDCPATTADAPPDARKAKMMLNYALTREHLDVPATAEYAITSATNPLRCQIAPLDPAINGAVVVYRRTLPSTNLMFLSEVRWDGRETRNVVTTGVGLTNTQPLVQNLSIQDNIASQGHGASPSIAQTPLMQQMGAFERALYSSQTKLLWQDLGEKASPTYLATTVAPAFYIGQNDPMTDSFNSEVFTLFTDWEPGVNDRDDDDHRHDRHGRPMTSLQDLIGLGEKIFNKKTFRMVNVPGLNSKSGDPLYNPADPKADQVVIGTCGTCHNVPNVGGHSTPFEVNIGATSAMPTNNYGWPIYGLLDKRNHPVYTMKSTATGAVVRYTEPGRGIITGKWTDIGKTKVPPLRALASRPPYFHDGSAEGVDDVIRFHNARFNIGLSPREALALKAFLLAL